MEKIKEWIPKGFLFAYLVKMLVVSAGYADIGIIFCVSAYAGLQMYLEKHIALQQMGEVVKKQNQTIEAMALAFDKLRNDMSGIKLRNDFQQAGAMGVKKVG